MTEHSGIVTEDHFRYLAARTAQEDEFLRSLKRAAIEAGMPPIWIAPEQGSMIQILLRLAGAREVIEVGTLAGYSAVWMARALPRGGRVRTIEVSGKRADFAELWVDRSDVADRIEILRGAGKDILPKFDAESADAAFIDADKESYPLYLEHFLRILRPGGLLMIDNAFAFGELFADKPGRRDVEVMRGFNELMARETSLHSIICPMGDGFWVAVKR